uniref:F-box domain-containing protein n=2 Tax=Triticum urartu TaxID=4572 RepID=A0A8R7QZV9_TRIUA
MAPPPPPAAECPSRTTVLDLDDDLLREVFLRLPGLPSLVRAALSCRTFLSPVRSSPAFRRSFRALHPSPFVGLFVQRRGFKPEASSFKAHHSRPDPDFEAAARGGD